LQPSQGTRDGQQRLPSFIQLYENSRKPLFRRSLLSEAVPGKSNEITLSLLLKPYDNPLVSISFIIPSLFGISPLPTVATFSNFQSFVGNVVRIDRSRLEIHEILREILPDGYRIELQLRVLQMQYIQKYKKCISIIKEKEKKSFIIQATFVLA
jgi:hypothetical protein